MPKKKTNEEFLLELEFKRGNDYTPLEEYKGTNVKINIRHNVCNKVLHIRPKDILVKGVTCSHCSGNTKLTTGDIREFIEVESSSGCKLITEHIENSQSKIELLCACKNKFTTTFSYYKHENKRQCNECGNSNRANSKRHDHSYVKSRFEEEGYKLLSEYINSSKPLTVSCDKGHIYNPTFTDFQSGHRCRYCMYENNGVNSRKSYEEVEAILSDQGYSLISKDYMSTSRKINIGCPLGHKFSMRLSDFLYNHQRCPHCYLNRVRENATSHIFVWLREQIKDWKIDSMKAHNYKCVVTNKPMDVVHHLYSFNLIAKEVMDSLNMQILENLSDYTDEQIILMKNKCIELHDKYGLGVCLTKEIHRIYHSIYGFVNNQKQFDEFVDRYRKGEFQELLVS